MAKEKFHPPRQKWLFKGEGIYVVCQSLEQILTTQVGGLFAPPSHVPCRHTNEAKELMMKKCPFCAEDIQDDAIKCKHCGEFLTTLPLRSAQNIQPWYFKTSTIIIALASVGPLTLPLIWWRPNTSVAWKIGITIATLLISWFLYQITLQSIHNLMDYYQLLNDLSA